MSQTVTDDHQGLDQFESRTRKIFVVWLPLLVFLFVLLFPFYWMTITAVKPNNQLTDYQNHSPFWVVGPTLQHVKYLLFETSYPGWLWNTLVVAVASTTVPHCWHSPQRPTHLALVQPHSVQRYARVVAARLDAMQKG